MKTLKAKTKQHNYEILIGSNVFSKVASKLPENKGPYLAQNKHGVLIADRKLKDQATKLSQSLKRQGLEIDIVLVTANEGLKEIDKVQKLYEKLIKLGANRQTILFALGGGALGDTVGFVAATFMRGIRWVGIPSTLLAQVDSSVGGKTAVNLPAGKNLVGAFHQPILVVCDTTLLKSLPKRELISGLGEVIKYGLGFDGKLLSKIHKNLKNILDLKPSILNEIIYESLKWKVHVINKDPLDLKGEREKLNLGHCFAHVLETYTNYKKFRHGEAVIYGLLFCSHVSFQKNKITLNELEKIQNLITNLPLTKIPSELDYHQVFNLMKKDKKYINNKLRFIMLTKIGRTSVTLNLSKEEIKLALGYIREK